MKDLFGQEINIGDRVAFVKGWMHVEVVVGFTKKKVRTACTSGSTRLFFPSRYLVLSENILTAKKTKVSKSPIINGEIEYFESEEDYITDGTIEDVADSIIKKNNNYVEDRVYPNEKVYGVKTLLTFKTGGFHYSLFQIL